MSKLERLLSVRKRALGDFEHHITEVNKFTNQSKAAAVSFRVIALEKAFKEFVDANDELEKMSAYHEIDQLDTLSTENRKVQDKYLEIKLVITDLLPDDEHMLNATFFQTTSREQPEHTDAGNTSLMSTGIKMPAIQLTPFEGDYEKWPEFRDMFTSLMKRYRGDDVEKLTHLKNYLKGPALEAVRHLALENGNYEAAWDELKLTFENKNAIIEANLRKFIEIPVITNASAASVRHALSTTRNCLSVIQRFAVMTETWDPMIVFMLKEKLSPDLRSKWEEERKGSSEPATLKTFYTFLEVRLKVVLAIPPQKVCQKPLIPEKSKVVKTFTLTKNDSITNEEPVVDGEESLSDIVSQDDPDAHFLYNRKTEACHVCGELHRTFHCPRLQDNAEEALRLVKERNLCTNCLYKHEAACTSKYSCRICQKQHNTLLHDAFHSLQIYQVGIKPCVNSQAQPQRALLATAMIPIQTSKGEILLRALVDQGSTANLLSERGAQLLQCSRKEIVEIPMYGVGEVQTGTAKAKTSIIIGSLYDKAYSLTIDAYIANRITAIRPITADIKATWTHLSGLQLADPTYIENKAIDILIGTRTFAEIIESGLVKGQPNEPIAQKTKLGWITSGSYDVGSASELIQCLHMPDEDEPIHVNMTIEEKLSEQFKAFWEVEEVPNYQTWSQAEHACKRYSIDIITRDSQGKLVTRLPFIYDSTAVDFLGESSDRVKHRFFQWEQRFARNPSLKKEYTKCIEEYIALGHVVELPIGQLGYVIPHHAVIKESSTTTKVRVVYKASVKTSDGYSLNDRSRIGPTILGDLGTMLLRWRLGKIALTANIEKMYRQFWIHPGEMEFQQILWRSNPTEPLKFYQLKTVTLGNSLVQYLEIRGLHFIAQSVKAEQPDLTKIIKKNLDVGDCQPSFDTAKQALDLKEHLSQLLLSCGLKWNSRSPELLTEEIVEVKTQSQHLCTALGSQWNDELSFKITLKKETLRLTQRVMLSETESLFDPLGFLALWLSTFSWDDKLPEHLKQEWNIIRSLLSKCSTMRVPRWMGYSTHNRHVSLHGYCDASEKAYAAVLYLRTVLEDETVEVQLVTAKTKIAPLKQIALVTLPHPGIEHIPTNRLSMHQSLQRMVQTLWNTCSHEYLVNMQQRPKWKQPQVNLRIGQLVIIKEANISPSQWVLSRILKTFPGEDNLIRCAEVKCKNTLVSRPIHHSLPIDDNLDKYERLSSDQSLIPRENVDA